MSRRVFVVEDNPTNLDLMLYLLKSFGFDAVGFSRAADTLSALEKEPFDLGLVDILMPEMDGFEFAKRVRASERTKSLPLIAVTALAMVGDRERVLGAGFDGYLPKPIDPDRFISQLQLFLGEAQRKRQPAHAPSGPLILTVDDTEVNRQVIRGALEPFGYRIGEASGAHAALQEIAREKPALILCDVHMPGGDGFTLAERVKSDEQMRDIPFIFISSTAWQTREKRRAMELGAQKFILRPIDPQKLLDEVR
ncbi:MAG TPA: response regulator, partial [Candidatus Baltobacteraceae bacterium]|nr:response regulator [Candidatus Baltobacteraceae bacterium]